MMLPFSLLAVSIFTPDSCFAAEGIHCYCNKTPQLDFSYSIVFYLIGDTQFQNLIC